LTVVNSTFSENTARVFGGGLSLSGGSALILNATITANRGNEGAGGGILLEQGGNLSVANSIVAGNIAEGAPEIYFQSGTLTSGGHNLIGDTPGDADDTNNSIEYQATDILDVPPRVDAPGMYGGSTPTRRLQPNSPAIDEGAATGESTDQRGLPRPVDDPAVANAAGGDGSDIGSCERQTVEPCRLRHPHPHQLRHRRQRRLQLRRHHQLRFMVSWICIRILRRNSDLASNSSLVTTTVIPTSRLAPVTAITIS